MKHQEFYCYPYDELSDEEKKSTSHFSEKVTTENARVTFNHKYEHMQLKTCCYCFLGLQISPDWKKKANLTKEFCNASNENKTKETLNFL